VNFRKAKRSGEKGGRERRCGREERGGEEGNNFKGIQVRGR